MIAEVEERYLTNNPDVAAAIQKGFFSSAREHYDRHGKAEGRAWDVPAPQEEERLPQYSTTPPADENAFEMFRGQWSSSVPGTTNTGQAALFDDSRISWLYTQIGDMTGMQVLELGPLEAGHTYQLEKAGAEVTAIEANYDAFLRCLVVKNALDLKSRFYLGDFMASFGPEKHYDLVVASGVLYHMMDPVGLLRKIAQTSERLFIWTHWFDPDLSKWRPETSALVGTKWRPDLTKTDTSCGVSVRMVPQAYGDALGWSGFCGGPETHSNWIYKEDLLALLNHLGYTKCEIAFESVDHQNGPSVAIYASKS